MIYPDPDTDLLGWMVLVGFGLFVYLVLMLSRRFLLELRADTLDRSVWTCKKFVEKRTSKFTGARMDRIIKDMETVIADCKLKIRFQDSLDYPKINSRLNRIRKMIRIFANLSYGQVYGSFYLNDIAKLEGIGIGLLIEVSKEKEALPFSAIKENNV